MIVTTRSKSKPSPYPPPEDLPPTPPLSQTDTPPPIVPTWSDDLDTLQPLNLSRANFAQKQRTDPWLGPLFQYLVSHQNLAILMKFPKKVSSWVKTVATNCKVIDSVIMYADKLMDNPGHYRIFVPSNPQLQRHFLHAYHDSPMGMHRGRDATYNALSKDFYWWNLSKHVRNWVCHCQHCICFKSLQPAHGPMQIRLYQHPFHTLGVDNVGELPVSPNGNKWILTAVCPFSNYLRAIPVPDKTATTAANALFNDIFLLSGFPSVLQSDHGGEWLNALLHRITQQLSIRHVFTSGFVPVLMGLQSAPIGSLTHPWVYIVNISKRNGKSTSSLLYMRINNTSPISGTSDITPFFLVFGRDAPSPESISLALPPKPLPPDHYAKHIILRMTEAHKQFSQINADLCC